MLEIPTFKNEPSDTVMNLLVSLLCNIFFPSGCFKSILYVLLCFDQYVLRVCILANDGFFSVQHGRRCFKILHFSRICKFVT